MDQDKINQLQRKIDLLQEKHENFSKEIEALKTELQKVNIQMETKKESGRITSVGRENLNPKLPH